MEPDKDNIVNGKVTAPNGDLRPDRLLAPGSGDIPSPIDDTPKFQSRVLSELETLSNAIAQVENHLANIDSILSKVGTVIINPEPARPIPNQPVTEPQPNSNPDLLPAVRPSSTPKNEDTYYTPQFPEPVPINIGDVGDSLSTMLEGVENRQLDIYSANQRLVMLLETRLPVKSDWRKLTDAVEVLGKEENTNTALVKKGYNDVDVESTVENKKNKKWSLSALLKRGIKGTIGTGIAFSGLGEIDDYFNNSITNFLYRKLTGDEDDDDDYFGYGRRGKRNRNRNRKGRGRYEDLIKSDGEPFDEENDEYYEEEEKQPNPKPNEENEKPPVVDFSDMGAPRGFNPKTHKYRSDKEPTIVDAEIIEESPTEPTATEVVSDIKEDVADITQSESESSYTPFSETITGILSEIKKQIETFNPLSPKSLEDVLDKQRAEEDQIASMDERLDGQDIETDVYAEEKEKKDDKEHKGLLDSLGGIADLLKDGGPIMGILGTIGTTLAVLGTAVGGFIAGWKLEEYLDKKFDIVNKTLTGIDNTLGSSMFTTDAERAENEFTKNQGENLAEFTATDYGRQWDALRQSRVQLGQENLELDKRIAQGDVVAQKLKDKNIQRDKEYAEKMADLKVLQDAAENENYEADLQKEIQGYTEAIEQGTWSDLYNPEGFSYDSKEKAEADLKLKQENLARYQRLMQKQRDDKLKESMLTEKEAEDKIAETFGTDEEIRDAWAKALPNPNELSNGEPKLNPVPVEGVSDEVLSDLISTNRKIENAKRLESELPVGAVMTKESKPAKNRNGTVAQQNVYREIEEGENLRFDKESLTTELNVAQYGTPVAIPGVGVVMPKGYLLEHPEIGFTPGEHTIRKGGRTRLDAIEDIGKRKSDDVSYINEAFEDAIQNAYDVNVEPKLTEQELNTGVIQQGGFTRLNTDRFSDENKNAIDEITEIYAKRQEKLEKLREGLAYPERGTELGELLQSEASSINDALQLLSGTTSMDGTMPKIRWERDTDTGAISNWEFGKYNPETDWTPKTGEARVPNLSYYEWKTPTNWDEFIENPLMRDMRKQGLLDHVYPYKGVSTEELGDYDILKADDTSMRSAWAAALGKAKPNITPEIPEFNENINNTSVTTPATVTQSKSKMEISPTISDDVREYEDKKIKLLETLNKTMANQPRSVVPVGTGGGGGGTHTDMRMSIDDVGLSMVNLGIFD